MSDERNISDADAAAIAHAQELLTPEGRREAGRRQINENILGARQARREQSDARLGRVFDQGTAAAGDGEPVTYAKLIADAHAEAKAAREAAGS